MRVETDFFGPIDHKGHSMLETLSTTEDLRKVDGQAFVSYVSALYVRTPTSLSATTAHFAPVFQEIARRAERAKKLDLKDIPAELIPELIPRLRPSKAFVIKSMLENWKTVGRELWNYNWRLVKADSGQYVTCDTPVFLTDKLELVEYSLGLRSPGVIVVWPVSKRLLVIGSPIPDTDLYDGLSPVVCNDLIIKASSRFVYAPHYDPAQQHLIARYKQTGLKLEVSRIEMPTGGLLLVPYTRRYLNRPAPTPPKCS
jgi:hypothetical protein